MKIVIIEDEHHTADNLAATILEVDNEVQIMASIRSVKEGVAYFRNNERPDLIFCDIQLGDGLSFEIFNKTPIKSPVIFCTAYDEYALKAFKVNGIDYILKPFTKKAIQESLKKYMDLSASFANNAPSYKTILELLEGKRNQKQVSVLVYQKDNIIPVKLDDIALFYIKYEVTHLIAFDQKPYSVNKTLEELEKITGNDFYRANRQFLINRKAITNASQYFARKLSVSLIIPFKEKIIISKEKSRDFLNWLSGN
ncbi:LytR/AlgR family response regulator transcription factor [Gaoshiqia sediminis]|uniref:LytTR family DNA-binding domain-containing protein n=1 Tax=Gaoshiqia sediminis TaxID=2986998 RepID=A0AA41Y7I8_9BACT|nr:LytTR family DNA-binding domain-containing protein [Gaoshiqia sediminis]MCW0482338.1 LytTR family DNA-binding domain-containing protein [Gaoshiqia sediminis]